MRFYTTQHPFYCGIDRHARTMYVCILDQNGGPGAPSLENRPRRPSRKPWPRIDQGLSSPSGACSPGTGSPTSVPTKVSLLSWGMLSP